MIVLISITILVVLITTYLLLNSTSNHNKMSSSETHTSHTSTLLQTPLPTPTYGPGGSFSVQAKTFIPSTTPDAVLSAIRDTSTWEKWNGFTPFFKFLNSDSPTASASTASSAPAPGSESKALSPGPEGWLNLGSRGAMSVFMSGDGLKPGSRGKKSRQQVLVVSVLEPLSSSSAQASPEAQDKKGYRIAWIAEGYARWQLHSERVTELLEVDDGEGRKGTEYVCWETFGGVLAPVVKLAVGSQLRDRFGEYAAGLRGCCLECEGERKDAGNVRE